MKLQLTPEQRELLYRGSDAVRIEFYRGVVEPLLQLIGHQPPPVSDAHSRLHELTAMVGDNRDRELEISEEHWLELLRAVIIRRRGQVAAEIEQKIALVHDESLKKQTLRALEPYDDFTRQSWFREGKVYRLPRLADYLVMEQAEKYEFALTNANTKQRQTDEKFHILQAPQLFIPDLNENRAKCDLREIGCAVAFIDIDDFKKFNTTYSEPIVDMRVLPKFMRTIEAHMFSRGYGYRFGGDEYMLLVNNASQKEAEEFFDKLRGTLAKLSYQDIAGKTTVSIGLVYVPPGCWLTSQEIQQKAAIAKGKAKQEGKNRIATYPDPYCEEPILKKD